MHITERSWTVVCQQITYQSDQQETDQENSAQLGRAGNVPESYCAHGNHEEIYCVPIAYWMGVGEIWEVARVLQLNVRTGEEQGNNMVGFGTVSCGSLKLELISSTLEFGVEWAY